MKTNIMIVTFAIILMFTKQMDAQKLPNVQADSQWLAEGAKVDGKLTEWDNQLKAYNKATGVEYLIANNAKCLYLAFRSTDKATTAKIMVGGITFTVQNAGKKVVEPSITVPFTNSTYSTTGSGNVRQNFSIMTDSVTIVGALRNLKDIKVLNFKGIMDTLISIYNEYEIKTSFTYIGNALTCEMMIPLALLGLSNSSALFAYQVKLNGVPVPNFAGAVPPPPPGAPPGRSPSSAAYINAEIRAVTDFRGKYTLAAKP